MAFPTEYWNWKVLNLFYMYTETDACIQIGFMFLSLSLSLFAAML